jgi:hypothetical protein
MHRSLVIVALVIVGVASMARLHAGEGVRVHDALNTPTAPPHQIDPRIVTCPAGDSVFTVGVLQHNGEPLANASVVVDFTGCPSVALPPFPEGGYTIDPVYPMVLKRTDAFGRVDFPLASGGTCEAIGSGGSGPGARVYVSGMLFVRLTVAAFDQDADLVVDEADIGLIDAKIGTADTTADFNSDGQVTQADHDLAMLHIGHHHASVVGVGDGPAIAFGVRVAPNPATGPVEFELRAPQGGRAVLAIHDVSGRRVATVLDREVEPGVHRAGWSGRDASGRPMPAGLYLYRARVGTDEARGALILAR